MDVSGRQVRESSQSGTGCCCCRVPAAPCVCRDTAVQNVRIAQQRDIAEKEKAKAETEAQKAEKVTQFLTDLFEMNDPAKQKDKTITARELLDKGARRSVRR